MSSTEPSAIVPCRLDQALSVAGPRTQRPWGPGRTASLRLDVTDADLQTICSELGAHVNGVEQARRPPRVWVP